MARGGSSSHREKMKTTTRSNRKARRRAARVKPLTTETCVDCRLHAARLPETHKARYNPPLGVMFKVKLGASIVRVCPRCRKLPWPEKTSLIPGAKPRIVAASLVERGYTSQAAVDRDGLRFEL